MYYYSLQRKMGFKTKKKKKQCVEKLYEFVIAQGNCLEAIVV
jgi:hypothetical protein